MTSELITIDGRHPFYAVPSAAFMFKALEVKVVIANDSGKPIKLSANQIEVLYYASLSNTSIVPYVLKFTQAVKGLMKRGLLKKTLNLFSLTKQGQEVFDALKYQYADLLPTEDM
jgi:hypothetical protein